MFVIKKEAESIRKFELNSFYKRSKQTTANLEDLNPSTSLWTIELQYFANLSVAVYLSKSFEDPN